LSDNFLLPNGRGLVTAIGGTHEERLQAMTDFSELDGMQGGYEPQSGSAQMPGPEILPDGPGEFEILAAELTQTPKQRQTVARIQMRVLTGMASSRVFERVTFFNRQDAVNYLGGEMMALGIDSKQWQDTSKTLSQHIAETLATLKGVRLRGSKVTNTNNGQTYHNFYINGLAGALPASATPAPTSMDSPF
jgi:hypothetical protein